MEERIQLLLKYKDLSAAAFADLIDVQRSNISHLLSGRNKPSLEFIQKVLKKFPEIRPEWLISGKGSMTKTPELFIDDTIADDNKTVIVETKINKEPQVSDIDMPQEPKLKPEKRIKDDAALSVLKTTQNKKIERIVIFYSDKSFSEYYPE